MTDVEALLPSLGEICAHWVGSGAARSTGLATSPPVRLFWNHERELGIGVEVPYDTAVTKRSGQMRTRIVRSGRRAELQVCVTGENLYRPGYYLLRDLVVRVVEGVEPVKAAADAYRSFRDLLQSDPSISEKVQLGLAGELVVLRRLVATYGPSAVEAWVGEGQVHDFRCRSGDIEVKTTTGPSRWHRVNGLDQLAPSAPLRPLFLASVTMRKAGAAEDGESVVDLRDSVASGLAEPWASLFADRFEAVYGDGPSDPVRWSPAGPVSLVDVDDLLPKITRDVVRAGNPKADLARLGGVEFDVCVDAMGSTDGSEAFEAVLDGMFGTVSRCTL